MNSKMPSQILLEPERYELQAAPVYHFDLDRRDFFKFLGAGLLVFSVLKPVHAQESGGARRRSRRFSPQTNRRLASHW